MATSKPAALLPYIVLDDGQTALMRADIARLYLEDEVDGDVILVRLRDDEIRAYAGLEFGDGELHITGCRNMAELVSALDKCLYPGVKADIRLTAKEKSTVSYFADLGFLCDGTEGTSTLVMKYRKKKYYDPRLVNSSCLRVGEDGIQSLNVFISVEETNKITPLLYESKEIAGALRIRKYAADGTAILTYPEFSSVEGSEEDTLMLNEPFAFHTHPDVVYENDRLNQTSVWPSSLDFRAILEQFADERTPTQLCSFVMSGQGVWIYRVHEQFQKTYEGGELSEEIIEAVVDWVANQEEVRSSKGLSGKMEAARFLRRVNSVTSTLILGHRAVKRTPVFAVELVSWESIKEHGGLRYEVKYPVGGDDQPAFLPPNYYIEAMKDVSRGITRVYQRASEIVSSEEE
jgi:hypothetical protein